MARYVTLQQAGDDGLPILKTHPSADREEVQGVVNEFGTDDDGNPTETVVDPGGELRVYAGDKLVKEYPAGVWRSCSAEPPDWVSP